MFRKYVNKLLLGIELGFELAIQTEFGLRLGLGETGLESGAPFLVYLISSHATYTICCVTCE